METFEEILIGVKDLVEAQALLRGSKGLHQVLPNLYFRNGQVAWLTLPFSSTRLRDALRFMNRLGVQAAPKLVGVKDLPSGESIVLYEIPGLPEEYPGPFSGLTPLERNASERLRQDMELMFATGYVHPLAIAGYETWRIVPSTGHIIFERWETLRAMTPVEIGGARSTAKSLIDACEL